MPPQTTFFIERPRYYRMNTENKINDLIRDFGRIKFEEPKGELYINLSVLLESGENNAKNGLERIINIQNNIKGIINNNIKLIEGTDELLEEIEKLDGEEGFIYQYPKDRLHFSFINFLTFEILDGDFKEMRRIIEETELFKNLKSIIKEIKINGEAG